MMYTIQLGKRILILLYALLQVEPIYPVQH